MNLKPFGIGGKSLELGYNLSVLVSHLEGLAGDESDSMKSTSGPKAKRLEKVEKAIGLLNEAMDMGNEE